MILIYYCEEALPGTITTLVLISKGVAIIARWLMNSLRFGLRLLIHLYQFLYILI